MRLSTATCAARERLVAVRDPARTLDPPHLPLSGHTPIKKLREESQTQLDGNWSSFQLANSTPPLGVIGNAIAPSARMAVQVDWWRLCFAPHKTLVPSSKRRVAVARTQTAAVRNFAVDIPKGDS